MNIAPFCTFALAMALLLPCQAKAGEGSSAPALQAQAPQAVQAAQERRFRLPTGLSVYLLKDRRFPLVCTRLFVRSGSTHETPEQFGISHVLEHMVFKGTTARPKGQVARDVESRGGYLNAYTSFDKTCYVTDMPARHWQTGIDVVRDMAFNPALDPMELENEKPVIISELEGNEDNPPQRLFLAMQGATLAGTPYGHPIIGTRETVRAVTRESLQGYIERWYQPQNMLLVVAGDIDMDAVAAYVEKTFAQHAGNGLLPADEPVDVAMLPPAAKRVEVVRGAWKKVYLGIAFAVPGIRDLQSLDLDVLSYLMAGDGTAWFERKYRLEKRLVDSISVSNMSFANAGMFTVTATLDADKAEPFFASIVKDLAGLKMSVFTAKELERAKFNLEDSFDRAAETLNGLASWRALLEFELGGAQGEANIRAAQKQVNFDQVAQTYARWIRPERAHVCVLAPEQAKLPDLEKMLDEAWSASKADAGKAEAGAAGAREVIDMGQGCQVVLLPDAAVPYLSLSLVQSGGTALIKPADQGLPALCASLLTEGFGGMDRQAVERYLAERASALSASAGLQTFTYKATGPSRFGKDLFHLLQLMLAKPAFPEKEFVRITRDMKAALVRLADNPMGLISAKLPPFLFGAVHPYGMDPLGTPENLDRFSRKDVQAFWKLQQGQPWTLAVAGSFSKDEVLALAKALPKPQGKAPSVEAPAWGAEKTLGLTMPARNQAHLMLVYPTVKRTHPDAPALLLLQAVLDGQSGLLFKQMRDEEGLGYTVTAANRFRPECGFMLFYIGTTPDKVDKAREGFARIIQALKDKPLPKELLEAGCNGLEGDYYRGRQSLGSRAGEASSELALGNPLDLEKELIAKTRQLTPEDLQKAARTYFANPYEVKLVP